MLYWKTGLFAVCLFIGGCTAEPTSTSNSLPITHKTAVYRAAQLHEMTLLLEQINTLPSQFNFAWLPSTKFHLSTFEEIDFLIGSKEPLAIFESVKIERLKEDEVVLVGDMQSSHQRIEEQRHYFPLAGDTLLLVDFRNTWLHEDNHWQPELSIRVLSKGEERWSIVEKDLPACTKVLLEQKSETYPEVWATWHDETLGVRIGGYRASLVWEANSWSCSSKRKPL